jgi:hypothetical protein
MALIGTQMSMFDAWRTPQMIPDGYTGKNPPHCRCHILRLAVQTHNITWFAALTDNVQIVASAL